MYNMYYWVEGRRKDSKTVFWPRYILLGSPPYDTIRNPCELVFVISKTIWSKWSYVTDSCTHLVPLYLVKHPSNHTPVHSYRNTRQYDTQYLAPPSNAFQAHMCHGFLTRHRSCPPPTPLPPIQWTSTHEWPINCPISPHTHDLSAKSPSSCQRGIILGSIVVVKLHSHMPPKNINGYV